MPARARRIGFVIDDLGHGGAQRQLVLIASALLPAYQPRVVVLSSVTEPHASAFGAAGIPVTALARRHGLDPARLAAVTRALSGVDLVHGFLDASNVYAFLAAHALGRPAVLFLSSDRILLGGVRARVLAWILRRADLVTVNSAAGYHYLTAKIGIPAARVCRVPNIVPAVPLPPLPGGSDAHTIGCVGRLAAVKRFDAVVAALPRVRERVGDARLVIVGDGPERAALETLAHNLGVAGAVAFTGALERPLELMARMGCLVMASAFEGLPNAALEAMSLGVPVVAGPAGDLSAIVEDGVTGVKAATSAPEALADAIVRALTDPALRERARREGPRRMREQFSEAEALRDLVAAYQRLAP